MSGGIVGRLVSWVRRNVDELTLQGVRVEEQFPREDSPAPWKATVGFVFNDILVTYTVWEKSRFQTSLIVFDSKLKRTVFFKDSEPETIAVVDSDLAGAIQKLVGGEYARMSSSF